MKRVCSTDHVGAATVQRPPSAFKQYAAKHPNAAKQVKNVFATKLVCPGPLPLLKLPVLMDTGNIDGSRTELFAVAQPSSGCRFG